MPILHQIRKVWTEQLALRNSVFPNSLAYLSQNQLQLLAAQIFGLCFQAAYARPDLPIVLRHGFTPV